MSALRPPARILVPRGEHITLQIGLASFMPGDAFQSPIDDDALRFWAMLRFRS